MNIDQEAVGHLLFPPSVRPSARLPLSSIRSSPSVRPSSVKSVGPWHFRFSVRRPLPRAPARPPAIRHSQRLLSLADSTSTFAADPRSFSQSRRRISSRRRKFFVQQWTAALRVTTTVFSVSDSALSLALPCSFVLIYLFFFPSSSLLQFGSISSLTSDRLPFLPSMAVGTVRIVMVRVL